MWEVGTEASCRGSCEALASDNVVSWQSWNQEGLVGSPSGRSTLPHPPPEGMGSLRVYTHPHSPVLWKGVWGQTNGRYRENKGGKLVGLGRGCDPSLHPGKRAYGTAAL